MLVAGRRIVAAGAGAKNQGAPEGAEIVDCTGKAVLPGLIDMRVFVGEPGGEHRETLETASRAAAAGGVTTIVTMPDTNPVIDDPALVDFVFRRARDTARRARPPDGGDDHGPCRRGDVRVRPPEGSRRRRLHRRPPLADRAPR